MLNTPANPRERRPLSDVRQATGDGLPDHAMAHGRRGTSIRRGGRSVARPLEVAILLVLPVLSHCLFPIVVVVPRPYAYLGAALMLLGLVLATQAAREFRRVRTAYHLHRDSPVLVTSGLFRLSRNPIYLAMVIWLLGLAALLGSLTVFLFPALLFLLANFLFVPLEENSMEEAFGEQYLAYRARVRRWI